METWKASDFIKAGICGPFVQDNHSRSAKGTVRGLHYQKTPHAQGKLVRVIRGAAWDVAVDLREGSAHYGRWQAVELTAENGLQLYIPPDFAHGFLALEENTELLYRCTAEYDAASEGGIRWDDPALGISWPMQEVRVSEKDSHLGSFRDIGQVLTT
jgi:dTDP-4-dehydrorhamnose 3,5-epimerase